MPPKSKTKSKPKAKSGGPPATTTTTAPSDSTTTESSHGSSTNTPATKTKTETTSSSSSSTVATTATPLPPIDYVGYESEHQLQGMMSLIENDLSEPYSIYTYRYFLHQWPKLSFLAMDREKGTCIGVIVCRLEPHGHSARNRGYIAMLAVSKEYRKRKIGSTLVLMAIEAMKSAGADEIVLETEYTNQSAIALYQQMGFIKDKRLYRYYLNGVDAFRLKLLCKPELLALDLAPVNA
ncbi:N-alpha-acetyltransferase 30 [Mortierella sp. GBA39]|nr:N-alpha-acetyltransferase 30 [Mortierella sp. GBA39]